MRSKVKKGSEIPSNQEINLLKMQQSIEKSSKILKNRVIYLLKLLKKVWKGPESGGENLKILKIYLMKSEKTAELSSEISAKQEI